MPDRGSGAAGVFNRTHCDRGCGIEWLRGDGGGFDAFRAGEVGEKYHTCYRLTKNKFVSSWFSETALTIVPAMPASDILSRFCVFMFVLSVPLHTTAAPEDAFGSALEERMAELLVKYSVPGAVVSRISNGEVIWTKAFGQANVKTGAPMQPEMVFNHGSNGKILTMWGIMRLVEQRRVELDAPANHYMKRWQLRSAQFDPSGVTIRRLLSHTAGLTNNGWLDYDQRRRLPSLVEMLEGKNQIQLFGSFNIHSVATRIGQNVFQQCLRYSANDHRRCHRRIVRGVYAARSD